MHPAGTAVHLSNSFQFQDNALSLLAINFLFNTSPSLIKYEKYMWC